MTTKKLLLITAFMALPLSMISSSSKSTDLIPVDICCPSPHRLQTILEIARQFGCTVQESSESSNCATQTTPALAQCTKTVYMTLLVPFTAIQNGSFQEFQHTAQLSRTTESAAPVDPRYLQSAALPAIAAAATDTIATRPSLPSATTPAVSTTTQPALPPITRRAPEAIDTSRTTQPTEPTATQDLSTSSSNISRLFSQE